MSKGFPIIAGQKYDQTADCLKRTCSAAGRTAMFLLKVVIPLEENVTTQTTGIL